MEIDIKKFTAGIQQVKINPRRKVQFLIHFQCAKMKYIDFASKINAVLAESSTDTEV